MIVYHDNGDKPLLRRYFIESGGSFTPLYRNYPMRLIYRKLRTHVPKRMVFNVPKLTENDDKIIVFDTLVTPQYLYWLCEHYTNQRIILWYWNPVSTKSRFDLFPRRVEIWSYSPADCKKYGFRYNTPFYFDCIANSADQSIRKSTDSPLVFFLGREKGRRQKLAEIKSCLEGNGAKTRFHMMVDGTRQARSAEEIMPYGEVLKEMNDCDIILDYNLNPEDGLSLRPMEAVYLGKKLITNNQTIVNYDFYREENIYILNKDNRSLREFFSTAYVEVESAVKEYYLLSKWLERFDIPENGKNEI